MLKRTLCAVVGISLGLSGCNTMPVAGGGQGGGGAAPQTSINVAPGAAPVQGSVTGPNGCTYLPGTEPPQPSQQNILTGAVIGAIGGAVVGSSMSRRSSVGARNGLLLGALTGALAGSQFKNQVQVTETADGIKVNIPGSVLFPTGRSDLNPQFRQTLDGVTDTLLKYCDVSALVVGHTDNVGSLVLNERLAVDRATSVVTYMAARFPRQRLNLEGRADREPLMPNTDANGRALNRRVEIFIKAPPAPQ